MFNFYNEFKTLKNSYKAEAIGNLFAAMGAGLLLSSSVFTVSIWAQGDEPIIEVKRSMALSLAFLAIGTSVTAASLNYQEKENEDIS